MDITNQRRMAAEILKCGRNRVKMNPNSLEDIAEAVTRDDIRRLIKEGIIEARQKDGISNGRLKQRMEQKAMGKKGARQPRKRRWISTIRPIRRTLREYRENEVISDETYRYYYKHASGGMFRSVSHMRTHMEAEKAFLKRPEGV
jgi:large subunit ribosomal protein L19e